MLIVFEGLDGAGKSTQAKLLKLWLASHYPLHFAGLFREPGSTPVAEQIRHMVKAHVLDQQTQLLLFTAARSDLLHKLHTIPSNRIILLDRYIYSTYAYQNTDYAFADKLPLIEPELVFLFLHHFKPTQDDDFERLDRAQIANRYLAQVKSNWIIVPNLDICSTFHFIVRQIKSLLEDHDKR